MIRRYFDHNAATPLGQVARDALTVELTAGPGNPSSIHAEGRAARSRIERARGEVAALVGASGEAVILCSGATEAIALGLCGLARRARRKDRNRVRVLVGASEHPAVHGAAAALLSEGFVVDKIAVDSGGRVDAALSLDDRVAVVAVQAANHETGVVQSFAEIGAAARSVGAFFFCDAVQAAGKLPLSLDATAAHALSLSSAKIYGPAGAGALVLGDGIDVDPLLGGGHQERGRRPGSEALSLIVGFGAAARDARERLGTDAPRVAALRDRFEHGVKGLGAELFGASAPRLSNTTMCAFEGVQGQLLLMALDLEGFAISTGAACTSGSTEPSAVLLAAGHPRDVASRGVRFSLGRGNTEEDIAALLALLPTILLRIRAA